MDLCLWRAFLSSDMWASIVSHMYDFKKSLLAPEHFPSLLRFTFNILHKFQQKICSFDQGWDPCYLITWHLDGFEKRIIEAGGGGWGGENIFHYGEDRKCFSNLQGGTTVDPKFLKDPLSPLAFVKMDLVQIEKFLKVTSTGASFPDFKSVSLFIEYSFVNSVCIF